MKHPIVRDLRDESGIALLVAVMLMLMVSAVALSALDRARQENLGSTAGRRKVATLIAADAGLRLVEDQLINGAGSTPDTAPIADTAFISFGNGLATSFRTGEIGSSAALPILKVGSTVKEGGQLNVGGAGTFSYGVYRAGVVASDPGGASVQLNAQWVVLDGSAGY
jgi:Tfp pilus assembly protein PilX